MILFVLVVLSYHSGLSVLTKVLKLLKHHDWKAYCVWGWSTAGRGTLPQAPDAQCLPFV